MSVTGSCSLPARIYSLRRLDLKIRLALGTVLWMGVWWVTLPVPAAITAFLPVAINAIFSLTDMQSVISCYSAELVFLLAGSDIISMAWEATGVDQRIAARSLCPCRHLCQAADPCLVHHRNAALVRPAKYGRGGGDVLHSNVHAQGGRRGRRQKQQEAPRLSCLPLSTARITAVC